MRPVYLNLPAKLTLSWKTKKLGYFALSEYIIRCRQSQPHFLGQG